ncbi:MAG: thrombospondin type 3 repeat-containing protein [Deltaproteobacteria bacterium]|nr:thrombospondin type 3 repeat-containing protein [Deltaproteobacteria bacterium]
MTAERQPTIVWALVLAVVIPGCGDGPTATSEPGTSSGTDGNTATIGEDDSTSGGSGPGADSTDGGDTTDGDSTDSGPPLPPIPCPEEWSCQADADGDEIPLSCDNAPEHTNPGQGDMDFDSYGDLSDLCPTVQSLLNTADSDDDGIGNDCDRCRFPPQQYQGTLDLPERYDIRNNPYLGDTDEDGIGDACDNCPTVPNCLDYGNGPGLTPYSEGMPLNFEDPACQPDFDNDGVGDACDGRVGPGAAAPPGFGDADDFDQDGLSNDVDLCPRLPTNLGTCANGGGCPPDSSCVDGVCNHLDPDADGVGTACDTCPFASNPEQVIDGMALIDDGDEDFVGAACETHPDCDDRSDPRPLGFYDVAVGGYCCTTVYQGQRLLDPDDNPLDPATLPIDEPGVLTLPPGCDAALVAAGVNQATALRPEDVGGVDALWSFACFLPQWDHDYDSIGDACDLCPFAYDPDNTPYVDVNGMEWPSDGAFCNGDYHCTAR